MVWGIVLSPISVHRTAGTGQEETSHDLSLLLKAAKGLDACTNHQFSFVTVPNISQLVLLLFTLSFDAVMIPEPTMALTPPPSLAIFGDTRCCINPII